MYKFTSSGDIQRTMSLSRTNADVSPLVHKIRIDHTNQCCIFV